MKRKYEEISRKSLDSFTEEASMAIAEKLPAELLVEQFSQGKRDENFKNLQDLEGYFNDVSLRDGSSSSPVSDIEPTGFVSLVQSHKFQSDLRKGGDGDDQNRF